MPGVTFSYAHACPGGPCEELIQSINVSDGEWGFPIEVEYDYGPILPHFCERLHSASHTFENTRTARNTDTDHHFEMSTYGYEGGASQFAGGGGFVPRCDEGCIGERTRLRLRLRLSYSHWLCYPMLSHFGVGPAR